jgi:hypothetical protein
LTRAPFFATAVLALGLDEAAFPFTGFASGWKSRHERRKDASERASRPAEYLGPQDHGGFAKLH